jgi:cytoskeletal protein RodZ
MATPNTSKPTNEELEIPGFLKRDASDNAKARAAAPVAPTKSAAKALAPNPTKVAPKAPTNGADAGPTPSATAPTVTETAKKGAKKAAPVATGGKKAAKASGAKAGAKKATKATTGGKRGAPSGPRGPRELPTEGTIPQLFGAREDSVREKMLKALSGKNLGKQVTREALATAVYGKATKDEWGPLSMTVKGAEKTIDDHGLKFKIVRGEKGASYGLYKA